MCVGEPLVINDRSPAFYETDLVHMSDFLTFSMRFGRHHSGSSHIPDHSPTGMAFPEYRDLS